MADGLDGNSLITANVEYKKRKCKQTLNNE